MVSRWKNKIEPQETLVCNEFIDHYMVQANGEYVKIYLYLLRHPQVMQDEDCVKKIADALCNTESDVHRALEYWKKQGVLETEEEEEQGQKEAQQRKTANAKKEQVKIGSSVFDTMEHDFAVAAQSQMAITKNQAAEGKEKPAASVALGTEREGGLIQRDTSVIPDRREYMAELTADEEFAQLLYVVQQYRKKPLTPPECETFAYLYEGLHMPAELLEYVAEYCVQEGHSSVRYMETVALNWHQRGISTVAEAKFYAEGFSKNSFAVMKALGQLGRAPAAAEKQLIDKWFREYGFSKEIVVEACSRTIMAIHTPSFDYVDKILTAWHKENVKTGKDIAVLDEKRKEERETKKKESEKDTVNMNVKQQTNNRNRFHNFDQHNYDYDEMMWKMIQNQ